MGLVCAHRGASARLPDNSLPAFAAAIASGCEVIETDVRLRSDGRLVLAHDTWDVTADAVDLAALLDLARGRVGLDLEIVEFGLERQVLDEVDGFPDWVIVTSTFPEVLREVRRLSRSIDTGLVLEAPCDGSEFAGDPFALAADCGASVTLVEDEIASPALLAGAGGRPLWVWTVNAAPRLASLLADPAVTGVITDEPALACELRSTWP
jgi:glycerophosphoryl diester phosphodiesterase